MGTPSPRDSLLDKIRAVRSWSRGEAQAPHKPLLLLYALARAQRGESRLVPFTEAEKELKKLFLSFGPSHRTSPSYPFWRLQNDGLWVVTKADRLPSRKSNSDPPITALRKHKCRGGFPLQIYKLLKERPDLVVEVAEIVMEFFPESLHDRLAEALGLSLVHEDGRVHKIPRDPKFRELILRAYERRCAICGLGGRLDDNLLSLHAAHVRPHGRGGPSVLENGLCLCALHHDAFDLGGLGVSDDHRVLVSTHLNGSQIEDVFLRYSGRRLIGPQPGMSPIGSEFQAWHLKNIFKGQARPPAA